jgi:putative flavoprotein involved in K+ transport
MQLPEFGYSGDEPDAFAPREDVVRFIEAYAEFIRVPIRTRVEVRFLRRAPDGFWVGAGDVTIAAKNVVIATGPYQQPTIPIGADDIRCAIQVSASGYRNPGQLPLGAVLVVGAGTSGCQIAEELLQAGRPVFLSVGPHRLVPRRYRGRDFIWWINALGLDEKIADETTVRQPPLLISGANGGHTINLRRFAAAGMVLAGRFQGAEDGIVSFASDLATNLAGGDESYAAFVRAADAHVEQARLVLPDEPHPCGDFPEPDPIHSLDLRTAGVTAVIWATGYRYDFGWIDLDVLSPTGVPIHRRGVTGIPGVYFLGLPLLHKTKSSFLSGVGEDAAYLADKIVVRAV